MFCCYCVRFKKNEKDVRKVIKHNVINDWSNERNTNMVLYELDFFFNLGGAKTDYILNTKISLWYSIVYLRIESFSTIEHLTEKEDNIIYFNQHAIKLSNVECISVNIISNSIEMREN